ncbi:MAG: hypothetical protein EXX96DRAFT_615615 [Benjaminiella poitrasii]|nr:MAG: hypothetical protein EXX96DRAFT_615615 [Benjaminiella poitrasii]
MNEKENNSPILKAYENNKRDINNNTYKNNAKEINTKEKSSSSFLSPGLKVVDDNVNRMEFNQTLDKKLNKEENADKKRGEVLFEKNDIAEEIDEERLPEVVRRSPASIDNNILDLPLFVKHEKNTQIHIHHKKAELLFASNIVDDDKNDKQTLFAQIKQLTDRISLAEKENEEKTKQLAAIRTEIHKKEKETKDKKIQIVDIETRIQSLDEQIEEQNEYFKELSTIIYEMNEKGLKHQEALQKKEDQINELLNRLSETNYEIMELRE